MYTIGYRLLTTYIGNEWAGIISERCSGKSRGRLTIPFQHQHNKVKQFYDLIANDNVADTLIRNLDGQRLTVTKHIVNTQNKTTKKAIHMLSQCGMTQDEIKSVIRSDCKLYKFPPDRSDRFVNDMQSEFGF